MADKAFLIRSGAGLHEVYHGNNAAAQTAAARAEAALAGTLATPLAPTVTALQEAADVGVEPLPQALTYVRRGLNLDFVAGSFRTALSVAASLAALGAATVVQAGATAAIVPGGTVQAIAANAPRASTRGLMVEGTATQLFRYASAISTIQSPEGSGWVQSGNNITVTANAAADPAGGNAATRLTPTAATGMHRVHQANLVVLAANQSFTLSSFFKADGYRRVYLQVSGATGLNATADLISGTVTAAAGTFGEATPSTVLIALAGGWYYFAMSGTLANAANIGVQLNAFVIVADDAGATSFAGDTGKSLLMFRPMLNNGLAPQTFLDSGASSATRTADSVTIALPAGAGADEIVITHGDGTPVTTTLARSALASANELRLHSDAGTPWLNRPIRKIELRSSVVSATIAGGRLKAAVRNLGLYPRRQAALAANDIPAITVGGNGTASVINGLGTTAPLISRTDGRLTYVSGVPRAVGATFPTNFYYTSRGAFYGYTDGTNTVALRATGYFAYEFVHTGTQLEIPVLGNGGAGVNFRVLVNGCVGGTASVPNGDGGLRYVRLVFGASGTRTIRVETWGVPCNGVNVTSSGEIASVGRAYPLVTLIGDSFTEGTGAEVGDIESIVTGRACGFNSALAGVGGTGPINPGGNNTSGQPKVAWTHAERLRDLTLEGVTDPRTGLSVTSAVAAGVIFGTLNDQGLAGGVWGPFGATLEDAISNRIDVLIDDWIRVQPGKPLFLFGPLWPSGQPSNRPPLDIYRIRDGMMRAAMGRPGCNVHFIDRMMPPRREGVWSVGTDQASLYTGSDTTHPTAAGHRFDGLTDAAALRQIILSLA